ncbi:hypothetical protein JCM5296_006531 [Sporobolomyces johnsonii]
MVQHSETSYQYHIPLPYVVLAHNQRYPSPYGKHILSSDVISRTFIPETNVLRTTRLMHKRGKMPKWAPSFISSIGTSWVLEESEIQLDLLAEGDDGKRELRTRSRNLDHRNILEVFEWQVFTEPKGNTLATDSVTLTRITSEVDFWLLRDRIEKFALGRLPKSVDKARLGLNLVATLLLQPSTSARLLASGPLDPYEFSRVPSQFSLAVRAKLDEARQAWLVDEEKRRLRDGDEDEPGRLWRERWLAQRKTAFKERVCALTGLLCEEGQRP